MAKIGQLGIGAYVPAQLKGEKGKDKKTSGTASSRFSAYVDKMEQGSEKQMIGSAELSALDNPQVLEDLIDKLFESGGKPETLARRGKS